MTMNFLLLSTKMKGVEVMNDCIFCKIISNDIPSYKIYEDEHVIAFLDISQATPGHTLVIPKVHIRDIFELDEHLAAHCFAVATKLAKHIVPLVGATGVNIVNNSHEVAGQAVFHFHAHIVPRFDATNDGYNAHWHNNMHEYNQEQLQTLATTLYVANK